MRRKATKSEIIRLWGILAYQFNSLIANSFLSPQESIEVITSSKGKIRYVLKEGKRILTLRPTSGTFSISLEAAKTIVSLTEPPRFRVIIKEDRELKDSVLARDIVDVDTNIRPNSEVVVVNRNDKIIGVGRAKVSGDLMKLLSYGEVVRLREVRKRFI